MSINQTSFWNARVGFRVGDNAPSGGRTSDEAVSTGGLWDNPGPDGNPTPPPDENASPWRRADPDPLNPSPSGILWYQETIHYNVRKTGYYCVGTSLFHYYHVHVHKRPSPALVPVTILSSDTAGKRQDSTDVPFHPKYDGTVLFKNKFDGQLPATDYPKVNFYLAMLLVYVVFASAWGLLCYRHVQDLLPIQVCALSTPECHPDLGTQYYLSGLVGFLVVEMVTNLSTSSVNLILIRD